MSLLARLFHRAEITPEEKAKQGERLNAKRRHVRGKMSKVQGELRNSWTKYRTWRGDANGKKGVKAKIKHLEAERKLLVKEMLRIQDEMKKLGYKGAAGQVDMSG